MEKRNAEENLYTYRHMSANDILREAATVYGIQKKQGEFTIEDLDKFPDDMRMELIDGVIYDMAAPNHKHQIIAGKVFWIFEDFVMKKKGKCIVEMAPMNVQLDKDDRTMVQPDVLITCNRDKLLKNSVYGEPDLVVEILSPSTRKKDITIKLRKYKNARVRELWIIEPDKKLVQVYEFEKSDFPATYTFRDKIPVGIFEGECEMDMGKIYEYMEFLYEEERENM